MRKKENLIRKLLEKPARVSTYIVDFIHKWRRKMARPFMGLLLIVENKEEEDVDLTSDQQEVNELEELPGMEDVYIIRSEISEGVPKKDIADKMGLSESDIERIIS